MDVSTPFADPIYDAVGEASTGVSLPHKLDTSALDKPDLPPPRCSPSSQGSPSTSPTHSLVQPLPSVSTYAEPLPPPIAAIASEPPYQGPNAKPYLVPVLQSYGEINNPAYSHSGALPYYQEPRTSPDSHFSLDDNGYMEVDAHGYKDIAAHGYAGIDNGGYMKMKSEEEPTHSTGN